jgi:hypothetical protein
MTEDEFQEREQHFATLKSKYQASDYEEPSPSSPLYSILKRLDAKKRLNNDDVNWLKSNELVETLNIFQQQEAAREAKFARLKAKYQATKYPELSVSSPLYKILQHLDAGKWLKESELNWLTEHELEETFAMAQEIEQLKQAKQRQHFAELKKKYKATRYEDSSPSSHLYRVLKQLDSGEPISHSDINFLSRRRLTETIAIAVDEYVALFKSETQRENQADTDDEQEPTADENLDTLTPQEHFAALKSKYDVDHQDKSPASQLYTILQKLDNEERVKLTGVTWLTEKHLFYPDSKIFTTYHKIEANFHEQEYKRTGNKWYLPRASNHWRSAKKPERALTVTNNINIDQIRDKKLKSALLSPKGAAFRDIGELDKAEQCARQAIEYQPGNHHPHTLMGAIYYERGDYSEGDDWFEDAIKRGASPRNIDAEIKRVIKHADKDKRREVVEYLLAKEPVQYKWAESMLTDNQKSDADSRG